MDFPCSTGNQLPTDGSALTGGFALSWKSNPSGGFRVQQKTEFKMVVLCTFNGKPNQTEWTFHAQRETGLNGTSFPRSTKHQPQTSLKMGRSALSWKSGRKSAVPMEGIPTFNQSSTQTKELLTFNEPPTQNKRLFPRSTENHHAHRRFNQTGRHQTGESASSVLWTEFAKSPRPFSGRLSS